MSRSRVERIWKQEGLKVPPKQPKRARLWLTDGSCVRLRPLKILTLIDEYTKEALAIVPARRIRSNDVIDIFADVMIERGIPEHIRSDNGPEMVAMKLREWLDKLGTKTLHIAPGSPPGRTATARAPTASCATSC